MKINRSIADLGLLFVGLLWGLGFVFVKIGLNEGIDPLYLLSLRFLIGTVFLFIILKKYIKKITLNDLKAGISLGFFQIMGFLFQTYGAKITTAGKSAFFTGINVVIVPYIFWILHKKKPDIFSFCASIICLLGIGVMSFDNNSNFRNLNLGDILTIISAFFFAAQIVFTGYFSGKVNTINLILAQMFVAGILFFSSMILISGINSIKILKGLSLISVVYLIIFSTAIATLLQTFCQKESTSTRASILLSTESLFAPLFSFFILGEILTLKTIIGAILILFSVVLSETKLGLRKE